MKKLLVLALIMSMKTNVFADGLTHFDCGLGNNYNILSVQFEGPRFSDEISFDLGDDIKAFLSEDEAANLKILDAKIRSSVTRGSCKVNHSTDVFLKCTLSISDWDVTVLTFSYTQKNVGNWSDLITVERSIDFNAMDLEVVRQAEIPVLKVTLNVDLPHQNNVEIKINKPLPPIDMGWRRCQFQSRGN